jgi:hypothetical protein
MPCGVLYVELFGFQCTQILYLWMNRLCSNCRHVHWKYRYASFQIHLRITLLDYKYVCNNVSVHITFTSTESGFCALVVGLPVTYTIWPDFSLH